MPISAGTLPLVCLPTSSWQKAQATRGPTSSTLEQDLPVAWPGKPMSSLSLSGKPTSSLSLSVIGWEGVGCDQARPAVVWFLSSV